MFMMKKFAILWFFRMEMEERVKTLGACSSGVINFGKKPETWKISIQDEDEDEEIQSSD